MILDGNISKLLYVLTEDTEITGNCRLSKITTAGHLLTVSTLAHHGISINGSKNPEDWGPEVVFTVPIYADNAVHCEYPEAVDPQVEQLRAGISAWNGKDGLDALEYWVGQLHANPAMTYEELCTAWEGWRWGPRNYLDIEACLIGLQMTLQIPDFDHLKAFLLSKSPAAWRGLPVPTGEVIE